MTTLRTQLNPRSQAFTDNAEHMQSLVDELKSLIERIKLGGGERYQARHHERGDLNTPRTVDREAVVHRWTSTRRSQGTEGVASFAP